MVGERVEEVKELLKSNNQEKWKKEVFDFFFCFFLFCCFVCDVIFVFENVLIFIFLFFFLIVWLGVGFKEE